VLPLLLVALGALATARLTRLATADYLTLPLRRRVLQAVQEGERAEDQPLPRLGYLFTCAWCMSIWIGAAVALPVAFAADGLNDYGLLTWPLLTLAYSQVTGLLAGREVDA
jgi:hypothetical protein